MLACLLLNGFVFIGSRIIPNAVAFARGVQSDRIANPTPVETAVTRLERQFSTQKAPRRQPPSGPVPSSNLPGLRESCCERSALDVLADAPAAFASPNNRAPPHLTA